MSFQDLHIATKLQVLNVLGVKPEQIEDFRPGTMSLQQRVDELVKENLIVEMMLSEKDPGGKSTARLINALIVVAFGKQVKP